MFEKQELTAQFQDAPDLPEASRRVLDATQGEAANRGVEAPIRLGERFRAADEASTHS